MQNLKVIDECKMVLSRWTFRLLVFHHSILNGLRSYSVMIANLITTDEREKKTFFTSWIKTNACQTVYNALIDYEILFWDMLTVLDNANPYFQLAVIYQQLSAIHNKTSLIMYFKNPLVNQNCNDWYEILTNDHVQCWL